MKKNHTLRSFFHKDSSRGYIHPERDWFFLLMLAVVFVLGSVVWNGWFFLTVKNGKVPDEEVPTIPFMAAPAESVVDVFEAREAEEARYRTEYLFVDPSR